MKQIAALAAFTAALLLATTGPAAAAENVADRDGDKVFDSLERRLAGLPPSSPVDVIVALREPATAERVRALAAEVGGFSDIARFSIIDAFAARVTNVDVRALARFRDVAYVARDAPVRATNNLAQDAFGAAQARVQSRLVGDGDGNVDAYSKSDLVAAVIDTGIDPGHRDLDEGKLLVYRDCSSGACVVAPPSDVNGHGTHIAATIVGEGDARADRLHGGVAPAGALVGLRVLNNQGVGSSSATLRALEWVRGNRAAYGIEVVNLSLGTDGCASGSDPVARAVEATVTAGLVVVVSAGNEGPGSCTIGSPAAAPNAITVGAMADPARGGFSLASFSSRGPTADGRIKPDIIGPGVGIRSAQAGSPFGYVASSGTSMAAPFVAGVALLMLDANPALSPGELKHRMLASAIPWGAPGADPHFGHGRLDAYAAIAAAGAPLAFPPIVPVHDAVTRMTPAGGGHADLVIAASGGGFPVAVTVTSPAATPALVAEVRRPDGAVVATTGEQRGRHLDLRFTAAAPGIYILRVRSLADAFEFTADVAGGSFLRTPAVVARPSITGVAELGKPLTASEGAWVSGFPMSVAFAWRRCDANGLRCSDVPGASGRTHVPTAADVGSTFRVLVTATDSVGPTVAGSDATAPVVDRERPRVRARTSLGRLGRSVRLAYRVTEATSRTRERVRVYRGARAVRTIRTPLSVRAAGRTYVVSWRAPKTAARYRFCVQAFDAAGNASARSCARIRLR